MTSLQTAQKTIKDLKTVISNLRAKYDDGYVELQQTISILQKEVLRPVSYTHLTLPTTERV